MVSTVEHNTVAKWLTQNYIEKLLQRNKKDNTLRLTKFEIKPAVPKGENYASVMTRVKLTYQHSDDINSSTETAFIVKTRHDEDARLAEINEPYQIFQTEMAMYETVLPKLTALLQEIGDNDKLFADTMHVDYENEAIIFEDLAVHDFVSADRIVGMDMVHAKLALKKLAKMHATAAVWNEKTQGSLETFTRGIFNRHTRNFGCFFENVIEICAEFAGDCPELGQYYKEKLLKLKNHVVEYATRAFDLRFDHFHTLIHGDYWINNVMIHYDEQNGNRIRAIKDLLIIDFQFCTWSSPAVDLHYFYNTSLEGQLRLNSQDELTQYYYGILHETLLQLNYAGDIPSLHEFHIQMEARRFYAVTSSLVVQTVMINDKTEDSDAQALHFDDERGRNFKRMLYTNKAVQENAKKLLPFFEKRGLLDVTN